MLCRYYPGRYAKHCCHVWMTGQAALPHKALNTATHGGRCAVADSLIAVMQDSQQCAKRDCVPCQIPASAARTLRALLIWTFRLPGAQRRFRKQAIGLFIDVQKLRL